jgi:hypothetical protein
MTTLRNLLLRLYGAETFTNFTHQIVSWRASSPRIVSPMNSFVRYTIPALIVGSIGGFFVGNSLSSQKTTAAAELSPREQFLSSADDPVDYNKLARVCVAAASNGATGAGNQASASPTAEPGSERVAQTKAALDNVMSVSLERGKWSRAASTQTRYLLSQLPPADVADFEKLLRTVVDRGDLQVASGAWVPRKVN